MISLLRCARMTDTARWRCIAHTFSLFAPALARRGRLVGETRASRRALRGCPEFRSTLLYDVSLGVAVMLVRVGTCDVVAAWDPKCVLCLGPVPLGRCDRCSSCFRRIKRKAKSVQFPERPVGFTSETNNVDSVFSQHPTGTPLPSSQCSNFVREFNRELTDLLHQFNIHFVLCERR